jgi:polyisoprenoid-binding protein YceI
MRRSFLTAIWTLASLPLLSCTSPPRLATPAATQPHAAAAAPAGARRYRIDTAASEIRLLVYRGGPMARLGHNHVIVDRAITGTVDVAEPVTASRLALSIPVSGFVVDDATARAEEGADFAAVVDEGARTGTLRNMLGESLLDGAHHATIDIDGTGIEGTEPDLRATLRVTIRGETRELRVPFELRREADTLTATGSTRLTHAQLGLTPFRVMLGALAVEDGFDVKFRLVARR